MARLIIKTREQANEYLKSKNKNNIICDRYAGNTKDISLFHCNIDNYEWETNLDNVGNKSGCPCCSGLARVKTIEEVNKWLGENNKTIICTYYDGTVSSRKSRFKCLIDEHEWNASFNDVKRGRGCPMCARVTIGNALRKPHEEFVKELLKVNDSINVINKYVSGHDYVKCECKICNYKWDALPSNLLKGKGCPCCAGKVVVKGVNNFGYLRPDLLEYLVNKEDGNKYTINAKDKIKCRCPICGLEKDVAVHNLTYHGFSCNKCKDGISYPNKFIFNSLLQIKDKLDFLEREYRPKWCKFELKGKIRIGVYDIYLGINNKQYIIEMDGGFHTKVHSKDKYHTLDDIKYIDFMKDKLAVEHNIEMIRIDCSYDYCDRYNYILHNILNSELSEILPLELINFDEANTKSQKSLLIEACNLWNKGYTAHEIVEELKVGKWLVSSYLKQGQKYNLCNDYSAQNSTIRSSGTKVTCVNTGISYSTITEPSKIYNIDDKGILDCCRGNDFSAGKDLNTGEKLFWMYTDDYNKLNKKEIIKYLIDKKVKGYIENISGKAVYCTTTNEVFNSIMDAVRAHGGNESGIRKCCRGEMKTSGALQDGTRLSWIFLKDYIEINNMTMEEFVIQHHYSSFLLE